MRNRTSEMRKRRKKLVLQLMAAGLICLLLTRFDFWTVFANPSLNAHDRNRKVGMLEGSYHGDPMKYVREGGQFEQHKGNKKSILREMMEGWFEKKEEDAVTECEIPYYKHIPSERKASASACHRKKPTISSCKLARRLFGEPSRNKLDNICSYQTAREFCKLQQNNSGEHQVVCDIASCNEGIYLGTVDIQTAKESWKHIQHKETLEKSILTLMDSEHVGYSLIRCGDDDGLGDPKHVPNEDDLDTAKPLSQILILPPFVKARKHSTSESFINFNFVFVDSVSRSHFFRSLPKSVKAIDKVAMETQSESNKSVVLDYHLVQAVRSRTYESLQTLFSGMINPFEKPFGTQSMPKSRLKLKDLTGPLRNLGYFAQWLEDLCPVWEWGIAKDFLVYNKSLNVAEMWKKLVVTLNEVALDSIGPTLSSCRMLHANGHPDPFHGPDRICYNGKQQHEYLLEYLQLFQKKMQHLNQPYFSFYQTNIGHEASGLRIQYFDRAFARYIDYAASLDNTLTVLFSDHGNAYGDFVNQSPEGRTELYNPFLYLIIPKKVQTFIGSQNLQTLSRNQHNLISLLDLHYTMKYLIEILYKKPSPHKRLNGTGSTSINSKVSEFNKQFNVSSTGLFSPISESRTCSHIPRIMPNLCICEGYDAKANNYEYNLILAMYVTGQLNNQILRQRRKHVGDLSGGFGQCYPMVTDKIVNVQRSSDGQHDTMKMDLHVKTPGQKHSEIFFIAVSMDTSEYGSFHLENFDRITQYSIYSVCADPGVDLGLCICDLDLLKKNVTKNEYKGTSVTKTTPYDHLKSNYDLIEVNGVKCLKVIQRSGIHGVLMEAHNGCGVSFTIFLSIATENLILSPYEDMLMHPNDTTFLVAGVAMDTNKAWDWDAEINTQV